MLALFSQLADWLIFDLLGLSSQTQLGNALHFFVEDTTKIFCLLLLMIYVIGWLRASLQVEQVRDFLASKHKGVGYFLGSAFGAITPFCSCSSIPVFLGFTSAGIPIGMTMAFLLTSPLINEVAEHNDLIFGLWVNRFEQRIECKKTSVNVSDGDGPLRLRVHFFCILRRARANQTSSATHASSKHA